MWKGELKTHWTPISKVPKDEPRVSYQLFFLSLGGKGNFMSGLCSKPLNSQITSFAIVRAFDTTVAKLLLLIIASNFIFYSFFLQMKCIYNESWNKWPTDMKSSIFSLWFLSIFNVDPQDAVEKVSAINFLCSKTLLFFQKWSL